MPTLCVHAYVDTDRSTACRLSQHSLITSLHDCSCSIFQSLPQTTYQDFSEQINLKKDFTEKEATKSMINADTVGDVKLER